MAFGLDAVVTIPGGDPVPTVAFWLPPVTVDHPTGADYRRAEAKRVICVPADDVPAVPRGTTIVMPEMDGMAPASWVVDETERIDSDHHRVIVTEAP